MLLRSSPEPRALPVGAKPARLFVAAAAAPTPKHARKQSKAAVTYRRNRTSQCILRRLLGRRSASAAKKSTSHCFATAAARGFTSRSSAAGRRTDGGGDGILFLFFVSRRCPPSARRRRASCRCRRQLGHRSERHAEVPARRRAPAVQEGAGAAREAQQTGAPDHPGTCVRAPLPSALALHCFISLFRSCIICNDDTDSDLACLVVGVSVCLQSPDGDLIDCVAAHQQPAFDHPRLRGQRPLAEPPVRPKGHRRHPNNDTANHAGVQLWAAASGEACPEGSVPIRRVTEADVLRASSVRRFGRAPVGRVRRDSVSGGHEVGNSVRSGS